MTSMRISSVRVGPRGWVLSGAVAAVIVAAVVWSFAMGRVSGDSPEASSPASTPATLHSAVTSGTTVRVASVNAGVAETTVEVVVDGRLDLGANVIADRISIVTDSAGNRHFQFGGSSAGRALTLRFPGAASMQPGPATLEIPGLWLTDGDIHSGTAPVDSQSRAAVELPLEIPPATGASLLTPVGRGGPLGPGAATIDSMSRDASTFLVSGTLSGFTREQIQAMNLRAMLVLEDATRLQLTGGSVDIVSGLGHFEFKFNLPSPSAGVSEVELRLGDGPIPGPLREDKRPEVQAALDEIEQAQGAILIVPLPR